MVNGADPDNSDLILEHPELLVKYLEYCDYREQLSNIGIINLKYASDFDPLVLLPIYDLILKRSKINYIPPVNENLANYVLTVFTKDIEDLTDPSNTGLIKIPRKPTPNMNIFRRVHGLQETDEKTICGGENSFMYLVSELVDNIYQHSNFSYASMMAQKNQTRLSLCFFDNGITIPKSFEKNGMIFQDSEAIVCAVNGLSSKPGIERGFGLGTSVKILNALNSQIFIASGLGAIFLHGQRHIRYNLIPKQELKGTLIALRIPYPTQEIDIYQYI